MRVARPTSGPFKDEGINLPEGNDVEGLQGMLKDLLVYVGGTIPVIKD